MSDDNDNLFELILGGSSGPDKEALAEGAVAMYEMYSSLLSAGFSAEQAFELVRTMLAAQIK